MNKKRVSVIFGGMSTEHSISIISGTSVIKNLDKDKYDILPVYIDKDYIIRSEGEIVINADALSQIPDYITIQNK